VTFAECARAAAARLEAGGATADAARIDVDVLARHVLDWDAAHWLVHQRDRAPDTFQSAFETLVQRRLAHEPVAYITGVREFYGRTFAVGPGVLIPRPETELVVEHALIALREIEQRTHRAPAVVDVGTGSGCIAISIALEDPRARVRAIDVSTQALDIARANAARLGASDRVAFREMSLLDGLVGVERVDLIVSNPPYVAARDRATLQADVVDFEPALALFGGNDGLDIIGELLRQADATLAAGGWLIVEFGNGQEQDIVTLLRNDAPTLELMRVVKDLAGIPRVLIARKTAASV
jgi:release factor glutamine methyltransferase